MTYGSWPGAALAVFIKDRSSSAWHHVGDASSAHVEAGVVVWFGIQAVRFAITEARSWGMGGGGGGGGWRGDGGSTWFGGGGRRQWGQL